MKNNILVILLTLLLTSCNSVQNKNEDINIIETIKQLDPNIDFSQKLIVLIIPFDGCSSCFHEALSLIPDVIEKQNIIIIPNRYKKRILSFLNDAGIDVSAVIIDTMQLTVLNHLVDINPQFYVIEKQKVIFSETVEITTIDSIRNVVYAIE